MANVGAGLASALSCLPLWNLYPFQAPVFSVKEGTFSFKDRARHNDIPFFGCKGDWFSKGDGFPYRVSIVPAKKNGTMGMAAKEDSLGGMVEDLFCPLV